MICGGARRRIVGLIAGEQRERRAGVRAVAPDVEAGLRLARGQQRRERRDRAAVHDHAAGRRREAEPFREMPRERCLAGGARLAQLVDRARAVGHRGHERPQRRQRQRRGQLMPDVAGVVGHHGLGEDALDERERVGAAGEVGRPALRHPVGGDRPGHGNRALAGGGEILAQAIHDGVAERAEALGIACGGELLAAHEHPDARMRRSVPHARVRLRRPWRTTSRSRRNDCCCGRSPPPTSNRCSPCSRGRTSRAGSTGRRGMRTPSARRSRRSCRRLRELSFATVLKSTGELIGDCSVFTVSDEHRQGEIGFIFHPDHHGCGYATEAARALLRVRLRRMRVPPRDRTARGAQLGFGARARAHRDAPGGPPRRERVGQGRMAERACLRDPRARMARRR